MQPVTILLIEDNKLVLNVVRDTLALEGMEAEACEDGVTALRKLEGDDQYDLIITDNDLPGVSGLELIRHARRLPHRQHTSIIMLSSGLWQVEARRAGADAFLRKPEDIGAVVETVRRLLHTELGWRSVK